LLAALVQRATERRNPRASLTRSQALEARMVPDGIVATEVALQRIWPDCRPIWYTYILCTGGNLGIVLERWVIGIWFPECARSRVG